MNLGEEAAHWHVAYAAQISIRLEAHQPTFSIMTF